MPRGRKGARLEDALGKAASSNAHSQWHVECCWKLLVASTHAYYLQKLVLAVERINGVEGLRPFDGVGFRPCGELRKNLRQRFNARALL